MRGEQGQTGIEAVIKCHPALVLPRFPVSSWSAKQARRLQNFREKERNGSMQVISTLLRNLAVAHQLGKNYCMGDDHWCTLY